MNRKQVNYDGELGREGREREGEKEGKDRKRYGWLNEVR